MPRAVEEVTEAIQEQAVVLSNFLKQQFRINDVGAIVVPNPNRKFSNFGKLLSAIFKRLRERKLLSMVREPISMLPRIDLTNFYTYHKNFTCPR